jgi:hypothetical protein
MLAPMMMTPVELPTSKASVLCPREVPAELSMMRLVTVKSVAELMLINWTGEFLKLRPVIEELFIE